jgi:phosphoribosylamine--glycine ligase
MKILIIGSGGREHAIAHKLSLSERKPLLYAAPGNAGIAELATCVDLAVDDLAGLLAFVKAEQIDLTIVGPELPLVLGIVDLFESNGHRIFGPNKAAAQFEGSKDFTKAFLTRHGIPTAHSETHVALDTALDALGRFDYPVVIKADGLAAGKGVIIAEDHQTAEHALSEIMDGRIFGNSGDKVVLETFLKGIEASILCFVDGDTILPMQPAQDYKKIYDGDLGPNTGGMGAYSPSLVITDDIMTKIQKDLLDPFIKGIKADHIDFKGILFVGIMIDGDAINVIEYNVRLGDPETEVTLIRLENDLIDIIEAVESKTLDQIELRWSQDNAVCVIMASGGYPEAYSKGCVIEGLDTQIENTIVYHCGTRFFEGDIVTNGGRVLGVTATAESLDAARKLAYERTSELSFNNAFYRRDIGTIVQKNG